MIALGVAVSLSLAAAADAGAPLRYLSLGDSFTAGTGVGRDRAFPALLARKLGQLGGPVELTNPSMNGYSTADLIDEELPLAAQLRPDLVTLAIGANDIVRGRGEATYRDALREIFAGLKLAGVEPRRTFALPQPDWASSPVGRQFGDPTALRARIERYNQILAEEAKRAGARYVDLWPLLREQGKRGDFANDGLHPSADALEGWAAALVPVMRGAANRRGADGGR